MARNKLTDLNNHLFAQLERLNDEEMSKEETESEVRKAVAMSKVAAQIIQNAKVSIDAMKLLANGDFIKSELPDTLGLKEKQDEQ